MDKINNENRQMTLDSLRNIDLTERQIIDLLLMLIDDWELRAEVRKVLQKNDEMTKIVNKQVNMQGEGKKI